MKIIRYPIAISVLVVPSMADVAVATLRICNPAICVIDALAG